MTPKEKCDELVEKFYEVPISYDTAKQCGLISVDAIMKNYQSRAKIVKEIFGDIDYWLEVKQ